MLVTMYPLYTQGKLEPQSEAILKEIAEANAKPLSSLTPQQARECFLEESWLGKSNDAIGIKNLNILSSAGKAPIRIYKPEENQSHPILVFFHGGGFVLGTLDIKKGSANFFVNPEDRKRTKIRRR